MNTNTSTSNNYHLFSSAAAALIDRELKDENDDLYKPPKNGEDKKERIASSIISVLDNYRYDS